VDAGGDPFGVEATGSGNASEQGPLSATGADFSRLGRRIPTRRVPEV